MSDEHDPLSLAERIYELEKFRFRMIARANVHQQMLITLLMQALEKTHDPIHEAELLIAAWVRSADRPPSFSGADPAYLDALAQEYQDAMREIGAFLLKAAQSVPPKSDRQGLRSAGKSASKRQ